MRSFYQAHVREPVLLVKVLGDEKQACVIPSGGWVRLQGYEGGAGRRARSERKRRVSILVIVRSERM